VLERARSHICQVQSSSRFCVAILLVREHSVIWSFVMGVEPVVGPKLRLLSVYSLTQPLAVFVAYIISLVECSALSEQTGFHILQHVEFNTLITN